MIIGSKASFGIDLDQDKEYRKWLNRFCFWIEGTRIGVEFEKDPIFLPEMLSYAQDVLKYSGDRSDSILFDMEKDDLFRHLSLGLYEWEEEYLFIAKKENWARFQPLLGLGALKKYQFFLVEYQNEARILLADTSLPDFYQSVHEYKVTAGEFDKVLMEAVEVMSKMLKDME